MPVVDPPYTIGIKFERLVDQETDQWQVQTYTDGDGQVFDETPAVVDLDAPSPQLDHGGFRYSQGGTVLLPPGLDRIDGDRFMFSGARYYLVGRPRTDHPHAFTGDLFWTEWTFEGGE